MREIRFSDCKRSTAVNGGSDVEDDDEDFFFFFVVLSDIDVWLVCVWWFVLVESIYPRRGLLFNSKYNKLYNNYST